MVNWQALLMYTERTPSAVSDSPFKVGFKSRKVRALRSGLCWLRVLYFNGKKHPVQNLQGEDSKLTHLAQAPALRVH